MRGEKKVGAVLIFAEKLQVNTFEGVWGAKGEPIKCNENETSHEIPFPPPTLNQDGFHSAFAAVYRNTFCMEGLSNDED